VNGDSDSEEEPGILEISEFERAGLSVVNQLKCDTFFACTQAMPRYDEVRQKWKKVCVELGVARQAIREEFYDKIQKGLESDPLIKPFVKPWRASLAKEQGRAIDQSLVNALLSCWLHTGLWLYTNQDRLFLLERFFGQSIQAHSEDAFRKRCKRLGLIGWNDFPSTYPEAPLRIRNHNHLINEVREPWEQFFMACQAREG